MEEEATESGVDRAYVTLDQHGDLWQTAKGTGAFPAALSSACSDFSLDEIQKAPELLPYIKMIVDERDDCGSVITGSQPLHLMKAVSAESLVGRVGISWKCSDFRI